MIVLPSCEELEAQIRVPAEGTPWKPRHRVPLHKAEGRAWPTGCRWNEHLYGIRQRTRIRGGDNHAGRCPWGRGQRRGVVRRPVRESPLNFVYPLSIFKGKTKAKCFMYHFLSASHCDKPLPGIKHICTSQKPYKWVYFMSILQKGKASCLGSYSC